MAQFKFRCQSEALPTLSKAEVRTQLDKWSLGDTLRGYLFSFDGSYRPYDLEVFLKDFFAAPEVQQKLKILATVSGDWAAIGSGEAEVQQVTMQPVRCSALSMAFFDRLYEKKILRPNGAIKGCVPEYVDAMEINSELTKTLLMDTAEEYDTFSEEERDELLFRLFRLLVVGGALNQYEDSIGPYFDLTRDLYKDVVTVGKEPGTSNLFIASTVVAVSAVEGLRPLFPGGGHHPQDVFYVAISPSKHTVAVVYNAWCG